MVMKAAMMALALGGMVTAACAATPLTDSRTDISVLVNSEDNACHRDIPYEGLGDRPGEKQAVPFGPGLISFPEKNGRVVAVDPDGKELFFTLLSASGPQIMRSLYSKDGWLPPSQASFSDAGLNTEPSFSPDGRTLYFISTRTPSKGTDIWKVERTSDGWSGPVRLGDAVNGDGYEWHPQVTAKGDLYFAAEDRSDSYGTADLYVSRFENGGYLPAENLGPRINTKAQEWDGYISPAGDYLIFKSDRAGGYGGLDLYISVRDGDSWSSPRNLGPAINTADDEDAGEVTADCRYLLFARSKPGAGFWTLYWIDIGAVGP